MCLSSPTVMDPDFSESHTWYNLWTAHEQIAWHASDIPLFTLVVLPINKMVLLKQAIIQVYIPTYHIFEESLAISTTQASHLMSFHQLY